nr:hypothetical protein [Mycobacterium sp. UM_NZ2]
MSTIWKFTAPVEDTVVLEIAGRVTRWLHVEPDGHAQLTLWAEVSPEEHTTTKIHVRGTGHPMTGAEGTHIGTAVADPFVWHVFADNTPGVTA